MARDVSIMISARDNFTDTVSKIRGSQTAFRKDTEELQRELNTLNSTKVSLKVQMENAKYELKEAKKNLNNVTDAERELRMETAQANYDNLRSNLNMVSKTAKQTERDIESLGRTQSGFENRAGSGGGPAVTKGIMSSLASAGAFKMAGEAVSEIASTMVGSAFGSDGSTLWGSGLSGVASGAAVGSMIAPGVGTAVGGLAGGALGLVQGGTQIFQKEDEAFKGYVKDQYDSIKEKESSMLESGSGIASQREIDKIAFSRLLHGDDIAEEYLAGVKTMANNTPFFYDDLTAMSKNLSTAYGDDPEKMLKLLTNIGDAGAAVGLQTNDMNTVATSLGRMKATGKTTLEYLNTMQGRGIDAYGFLAEGIGKSKEEMLEMVSKGLIPGAEAAELIADGMERAFGGSMQLQSEAFAGLTSTVEGLQAEIDAAMGDGYNKASKKHLADNIAWFQSENGEEYKKIQEEYGKFKADVENEKVKMVNDARDSLMNGAIKGEWSEEAKGILQKSIEEYSKLKVEAMNGSDEAAAKQRVLFSEIEAMAENEYMSTDGYKLMEEAELNLIERLRNNAGIQGGWENAGYTKGEEFTKGIAAAISATMPDLGPGEIGHVNPVFSLDGDDKKTSKKTSKKTKTKKKAAFGMSYVPFDDFPSLLHEGERVLTASENREYQNGGHSGSVVVTGNDFTVREEADVYKIAQAIAEELEKARPITI